MSYGDSNGTVYVDGIPESVTPSDIADLFGSIGVLKVDRKTGEKKIKFYYDDTGKFKGDCVVTYDDPHSAGAAVDWFNNKEFKGGTIRVSIASSKSNRSQAPYNHRESFGASYDRDEYSGRGSHGGRGRDSRARDDYGAQPGYGGHSGRDSHPRDDYGAQPGYGGHGGRDSHARDDYGAQPGYGGHGGRDYHARDDYGAQPGYGGHGGRDDYGAQPGYGNPPVEPRDPYADARNFDRDQDSGFRGRGRGGGRGRGRGKFAMSDGDWPCPSCGNINFARRRECNRCQTARPADAPGPSRSFESRGERTSIPSKDGDWPCKMCGNMNYKWRDRCNLCDNPKVEIPKEAREGRGGGFKDLQDPSDRKRLETNDDDDGYDEFGRKKRGSRHNSNSGQDYPRRSRSRERSHDANRRGSERDYRRGRDTSDRDERRRDRSTSRDRYR